MFKYSNICYVSIHVPGTKDDVNDFDILAAIKAIDNVDAFYEIHITFYCNSTYKI